MEPRRTMRSGISKKIAVRLLKGPLKPRELTEIFKRHVSMNSLKDNGLVELSWVSHEKANMWRLTPSGLKKAVQWEQDLKMKNDHPDQEPTVKKIVEMRDELVEDEKLKKEKDQKMLADAGLIQIGELPEGHFMNMTVEEHLREELYDLNERYLSFLEEIVKNCTKKGE